MGYAQDVYGGEYVDSHNVCDLDSVDYSFCICNGMPENCEDLGEVIIYPKCDPRNPNYYNNLCECEPEFCDMGDCNDPSSLTYPCTEPVNTDCSEYGETAYLASCGCIGGNTGIDECPPEEEQTPPEPVNTIQTWYLDFDSDGYHGSTYEAVVSPGDKWKTTTSGVDCDDARPQYTTVCCTKTCESGYELNIDTCECELLPPCWGTVKDFETSNSFSTNTILDKLNSTLGDFGISTDIMDIIKQMNVLTPEAIAAGTDFRNFTNDLGSVGNVTQVGLDYFKYIDDPSSQNLLRLAFDASTISLGPAASLAISTIDYSKDSDGNSKLDLLLKAAADAIVY